MTDFSALRSIKSCASGESGTWVVAGTVTNICVLHTAGKASLHGYRVSVAEDGTSSLDPFDQVLGLRQVTEVFSGEVCCTEGITFS